MPTLVGSVAGGGTNDFFGSGDLGGSRYQAVADGTADQAQINVRAGGTFTSITVGIYSDSAGVPGSLLGQSSAITDTSVGTKTAAIASGPAITTGTFYWLMVLPLGGSFNFTGNSGVTGYRGQSGSATFETPWVTAGDFTDGSANVGMPILIEQAGSGAAAPGPRPYFNPIPFMR